MSFPVNDTLDRFNCTYEMFIHKDSCCKKLFIVIFVFMIVINACEQHCHMNDGAKQKNMHITEGKLCNNCNIKYFINYNFKKI